jgi:3-isopropylmalate/(R)-2-methylmalate dehydratase small subunit
MRAFTTLTSVAAPFPLANVDTDTILPARFMKTLTRTGLGAHLFAALRYDADGNERADFVLNRAPFRTAAILIVGENFGCGSSREHAPWALLDFGMRCIIAPSFGDIFFSNCQKNGILPVVLAQHACDELLRDAERGVPITVDLERNIVRGSGEGAWPFATDPFRRDLLLRGEDDIDVTLRRRHLIAAYEAAHPAYPVMLHTCTGSATEHRESRPA